MDEDQEMEWFGMENDYEDGQWIGDEFHGNRRQKRGPQTKDDVLYGVFAASSDSDSDSKTKKRKRMKGQSKNIDHSNPVNFVSTGSYMPDQELNQDLLNDNKPTLDENALKPVRVENDKVDNLFLPTAFGKKIQEGVNKREKEKEKLMKIQNLSQASGRKESDCDGVVGEFEKHTKGIGMKLLEKMGYKGGGLGKNQQGIMAPIETKLRPKNMGMGFNDYKEAVRPALNEKLAPLSRPEVRSVEKSWLKHAVKKKKPVYITAEELLTLKQERDFEFFQKVFDRRGPQVRVLTNLKNLNAEEKSRENDVPMPELQYNIKSIINSVELETQNLDKKLRNESETVVALQKEMVKLQNYASQEKQQLEKMEDIVNELGRIDKLISSSGCSLTLESLAKWFVDMQTGFADERMKFKLSCIACSNALPLFVRNFQGWDPLKNPTHGVEVVSIWKELLQQGKDSSGSASPYVQLLAVVVFPAVRTCGTNSWSPKEPEPMIRFLESWKMLLPPAMMQAILDIVIVPKISAAVDSWDPCRETIRIDLWVHPWMPWLGQKLENCYRTIRDRLSRVLHAWHPSDLSAHNILYPWKTVFDPASWDDLMVKHIIPKLNTVMQELQINPAGQNLDPFYWVRTWVTVIPTHHMLLLMDTFFNKWQQVLYHWLCSEPNFKEVMEWFIGWKEQLPPELQANEHIRLRLNICLNMMNKAVEGMEVPRPENISYLRVREQKHGKSTEKPKEEKMEDYSLKEVIEKHAQNNGLLFNLKPGRMQAGHQIYKYGNISIIVDSLSGKDKKVLAQNEERWSSVSLEELLDLHNRSTLKRH